METSTSQIVPVNVKQDLPYFVCVSPFFKLHCKDDTLRLAIKSPGGALGRLCSALVQHAAKWRLSAIIAGCGPTQIPSCSEFVYITSLHG